MIPFTSKKIYAKKLLFAPIYIILSHSLKWLFNGDLAYAELSTYINLV